MRVYVSVNTVQTGANINAFMKTRGIRVSQLQAYFGFNTPQAIYNWMRGKSAPSLDNLLELSHYFGTTLDALVGKNIVYDQEPSADADGVFL